MSKRTARLVTLLWLALPAGAIYTIWTGDLRPLGIGIVLFLVGTLLTYIVVEGTRQAAKIKAAAQAAQAEDAQ